MKYVGIDLHKKSIAIYVVNHERQKLDYQRFACSAPEAIVAYCKTLGAFEAVVEARASYEWDHFAHFSFALANEPKYI
jgi:hypothetical protein